MFIGTYETAANDCWLSQSSTPVHSQTHQVILTPHFVDRRKKRLIQTSFFHHSIGRGSTEPDSLDKAPYYGDKYSPVVSPYYTCTLNPTIMGVHGMSTQLLGKLTVGRLGLLLWLHV